MRVAKGSFAEKMGIALSPNLTTLKLKRIGKEWTTVVTNPTVCTRGKLF